YDGDPGWQAGTVCKGKRKLVQEECHRARKGKTDPSLRVGGTGPEDSTDDNGQTRADSESRRKGKISKNDQREGEALEGTKAF
ncbi:hypothetical protein PanWU01x14_083920, partial [Parasponia andersonii]